MADLFANWQASLFGPGSHAASVTPSDSTDLTTSSRMLYVGGAGDITLDTVGGETSVLFKAVPVGTVRQIRAQRIRAPGTTATNILALW